MSKQIIEKVPESKLFRWKQWEQKKKRQFHLYKDRFNKSLQSGSHKAESVGKSDFFFRAFPELGENFH